MAIFSFTQEYIKTQQRKLIINSLVLVVIIFFLLLGYFLLDPLSSFDVSVQWLFPIVIIFTLIISIYLFYKNMQSYLSMEIEFDDDKISASYFENTHKVITRGEIKRIVDLKGKGLRIDHINSELSIYLPKELQNYEQLRTGLSEWSSFIYQTDPIIKLFVFLLVLIVAGLVMIIYPPIFMFPIVLNGLLFLAMLSILIRFLKRKNRHVA